MDVQAIHTALVTLWPNGIPREQYVALAGIFKVCGDLEVEKATKEITAKTHSAAKRQAYNLPKHDTQIASQLLDKAPSISPKETPKPFVERVQEWQTPEPVNAPPPGPLKGTRAFVSVKTMESVKTLLAAGAHTKVYIERALSLSPRAVRYALAALRERKLVKRIPGKGREPHAFCLV
jgi:DNA-binding transcriptional ArsR family regulator